MRKSRRLRQPGHMWRATLKNIKGGSLTRFRANKAIPHHGYGIRAEMGGRHRARSACGTQAESSLLPCHLRLVPHVWTKGFLSASMEQGRRWAEGMECGLHVKRRPEATFSSVIPVLSLMSIKKLLVSLEKQQRLVLKQF